MTPDEKWEALRVACPRCHSPEGQSCMVVNRGPRLMETPHARRLKLAENMMAEAELDGES